MNNNYIFKKLLSLFHLNKNPEILEEIFVLGGTKVTKSQIKGWRTDLDKNRASKMSDFMLETFLRGLFAYRDKLAEQNIKLFHIEE